MRYLIGIAIGLAIIFNWTYIKSYFDKKIDEQTNTSISKPDKEGNGDLIKKNKEGESDSGAQQDPFSKFK